MSTSLARRVLTNTGALAAVNIGRIAVSFVVQLLVARSLGLVGLGHYTVAMAYLNLSQVISDLGLPLWLVRELAQTPAYRRAYLARSLVRQGGAALILWAALVGLAALLPYAPEGRAALVWVGASLPLFAATSAVMTLFQAAERMAWVWLVEWTVNGLILAGSVWALARGGNVVTLMQVLVVAQAVGMLLAWGLLARMKLLRGAAAASPWSALPIPARPFFGLSLSDVLLQRGDILLLSLVADARVLGIYSAAYNLARVAIKLLQSVWRGVYPTLARLYPTAPDQAAQLAQRVLGLGVALCVGGALLGSLLAAPVLRLVYGPATPDAGPEAVLALRLLLWQAPLFFVELYATTWLLVRGQARAALGVALLHAGALFTLLPLGAAAAEAVGAAVAALLAQGVGSVAGLRWLRRDR